MNLKTIKCFLKKPELIVGALGSKGLLNWMPDRMYLSLMFRLNLGYWPDFDNPKTFNEKLNWLKLYDRKPEYTRMVDKYAVREYIAEKIGEEYLIPLVGGPWNSADEIDFDALPEQFVLKTTHDSGGVVICRDKASFDVKAAKRKLNWHLKREYFWGKREWPYKNVKPRIIAEKYMQDRDSVNLPVYKIMCFNGEPKIFQTIQNDKTPEESIDYFDTDWNLLRLRQNFPNSEVPMAKPETLAEMLALAGKLSAGHAFLRTDFYNINGKTYFSEITFYSDAGFAKFEPETWDNTLGEWIELNKL
ncbi:MAG: glycosyl transferase [Oscillospiraceae bacterium]|nr:glycosyl transferase [Oscillospiraceae bacterium]